MHDHVAFAVPHAKTLSPWPEKRREHASHPVHTYMRGSLLVTLRRWLLKWKANGWIKGIFAQRTTITYISWVDLQKSIFNDSVSPREVEVVEFIGEVWIDIYRDRMVVLIGRNSNGGQGRCPMTTYLSDSWAIITMLSCGRWGQDSVWLGGTLRDYLVGQKRPQVTKVI